MDYAVSGTQTDRYEIASAAYFFNYIRDPEAALLWRRHHHQQQQRRRRRAAEGGGERERESPTTATTTPPHQKSDRRESSSSSCMTSKGSSRRRRTTTSSSSSSSKEDHLLHLDKKQSRHHHRPACLLSKDLSSSPLLPLNTETSGGSSFSSSPLADRDVRNAKEKATMTKKEKNQSERKDDDDERSIEKKEEILRDMPAERTRGRRTEDKEKKKNRDVHSHQPRCLDVTPSSSSPSPFVYSLSTSSSPSSLQRRKMMKKEGENHDDDEVDGSLRRKAFSPVEAMAYLAKKVFFQIHCPRAPPLLFSPSRHGASQSLMKKNNRDRHLPRDLSLQDHLRFSRKRNDQLLMPYAIEKICSFRQDDLLPTLHSCAPLQSRHILGYSHDSSSRTLKIEMMMNLRCLSPSSSMLHSVFNPYSPSSSPSSRLCLDYKERMKMREEFLFWKSKRPDITDEEEEEDQDDDEDDDSSSSTSSCGVCTPGGEEGEEDSYYLHAKYRSEIERRKRGTRRRRRRDEEKEEREKFSHVLHAPSRPSASSSGKKGRENGRTYQSLISFAWALYWQEYLDMKIQCQSARQDAKDRLLRRVGRDSVSRSLIRLFLQEVQMNEEEEE